MTFLLLIFVTQILLCICNPISKIPESVYDVMSKNYSIEYQCPYLRKSPFLNPKPAFLDKCGEFEKAANTAKLNEESRMSILCLLYFNSFYQLCFSTKNVSETFLESKIPKTAYDTQVNNTTLKVVDLCKDLQTLTPMPKGHPGFKVMIDAMNNSAKCAKTCVDVYDSSIHDICKVSSYMLQVASKLDQLKENAPLGNQEKALDAQSKSVPINQVTSPGNEHVPSLMQSTLLKSIPVSEKIDQVSQPTLKNSSPVDTNTAQQNSDDKHEAEPKATSTEPLKAPKSPAAISAPGISEVKMESSSKKTEVESKSPTPKVFQPNMEPVPDKKIISSSEKIDLDRPSEEQEDNKIDQPDITLDEADGPMENDEDANYNEMEKEPVKVTGKKPPTLGEDDANAASTYASEDIEGESYFFSYFMTVCVIFVLCYVGYHNKQKILALVLEGRRGKRPQRGRRPNSANYHKLDSNLEEAVTSSCSKNTTQVIY